MKHVWSKIPGFCDPSIVRLYEKMVHRFPKGSVFVEVGALFGSSASVIVVESLNQKKEIELHVVDPFKRMDGQGLLFNGFLGRNGCSKKFYDKFEYYMTKYGLLQHLTVHKDTSANASKSFEDASVDFVFIDANHTYKSVKANILAWHPKIKRGGIIAGHDYKIAVKRGRRPPKQKGLVEAVNEAFGVGKFKLNGKCWIYEVK